MSIGYNKSRAKRHLYFFPEASDSFEKDGWTVSLACYPGDIAIETAQIRQPEGPHNCFIWVNF